MRIALIGQSAFGEAVLRALAQNGADEIVGVFCPRDREGRPVDPIKSAAVELGVDVFQPRRMRSARAIREFRSLDADLGRDGVRYGLRGDGNPGGPAPGHDPVPPFAVAKAPRAQFDQLANNLW